MNIHRLLQSLLDTSFESWPAIIRLKAVSANANGIVNSAILKFQRKTYYITRQHKPQIHFLITQTTSHP